MLDEKKIYISKNIVAHLVILRDSVSIYFGAKMYILPMMHILNSDVSSSSR